MLVREYQIHSALHFLLCVSVFKLMIMQERNRVYSPDFEWRTRTHLPFGVLKYLILEGPEPLYYACLSACLFVTPAVSGIRGADEKQKLCSVPRTLYGFNLFLIFHFSAVRFYDESIRSELRNSYLKIKQIKNVNIYDNKRNK